MAKRPVGILVDSSYGLTEKEARKQGFFFVPILIDWDGKTLRSGIEIDNDFISKNLTKNTDYKTAATKYGDVEEEYEKALKEVEHVIHIPISKHLSSTINTARLVASEEKFKGKVTVFDSEFISPWIMQFNDILAAMANKGASKEEIIELLELQRGEMYGWLFPKNLDRVYASGRLSKVAYMAGTLFKITPIVPVENGKLKQTSVIKTRSPEKALQKVRELVEEQYRDFESRGKVPKLITVLVGDDDSKVKILEQMFIDDGFPKPIRLWLSPEICGHVGNGALGAGCGIDVPEKFKKWINK